MIVLVPAVSGALIAGGAIAAVAGFRHTPEISARPQRCRQARLAAIAPRAQLKVVVGLVVGVVAWVITGWFLVLVLAPVMAVALPSLVGPSPAALRLARLDAMGEWTRSLASVLTVGIGLEQALVTTLRSTPAPIEGEVRRLVARLRARWDTEAALHQFADELDDAAGDRIAASLILGAQRRGVGLASVLEALADSVSNDVRAGWAVEADQAKPRTSARWVTIISIAVIGLLAFTGSYVAPYRTALGQLILAILLGAYVMVLAWLHRMAAGRPMPRFLHDSSTVGSGRR